MIHLITSVEFVRVYVREYWAVDGNGSRGFYICFWGLVGLIFGSIIFINWGVKYIIFMIKGK